MELIKALARGSVRLSSELSSVNKKLIASIVNRLSATELKALYRVYELYKVEDNLSAFTTRLFRLGQLNVSNFAPEEIPNLTMLELKVMYDTFIRESYVNDGGAPTIPLKLLTKDMNKLIDYMVEYITTVSNWDYKVEIAFCLYAPIELIQDEEVTSALAEVMRICEDVCARRM